jgi:CheY-like chemotaxis protein
VDSPIQELNNGAPHAPIETPESATTNGGTRHKILYIEDNLSNLRLLQRILAHRPQIELVTAMQGQLGLDLARVHQPDLIYLDLHLPDISGHEVLEQLQADPITRDIPVVVVSADATPRQVERLLAAGARAYLTKPLDVRQFYGVLDSTLMPKT